MTADQPLDPFAGDPDDPAAELGPDITFDEVEPLTPGEREAIVADLADLDGFQQLLEHRGVRGLLVDCRDCDEPHYFGWDLLRANLQQLLEQGQTRVHEPAHGPDPSAYVSWDYARGYADAVLEAADD
ncbi:MAG TPA: DUF5319 domain-containing protein [Mycobacteriales bacterium]|jgi:hypothetical protein|nr:DUF5319 domain-containing protein [Mycobacteriales bacterium]